LRFSAVDRDIIGDDHIELTSVGVDIGSSTSHLVFSHLVLEREGERYVMVERSILHESDILLTPYSDPTTIDGKTLGEFIERQYESAELTRDQVDTGALILTGTALMRENSRTIADLFAEEAGRFVAVSAGDRLEASLAAHGSGAAKASDSDEPRAVLNVDIGGGTTKLALCLNGRVFDVAAVDVGARLVALDKAGNVTRIEDAARLVAKHLDISLELGKPLAGEDLKRMAGYLADKLFEVVKLGELSPGAKELMRTPNVDYHGKVDALMFSGGVSEFIYGHQTYTFGDMGDILGGEIRKKAQETGLPLLEPVAGIRATVVGASQHTVQVSGNTIYLSSPDIVPVRNVPVARPHLGLSADNIEPEGITKAVRTAVDRLDLPADNCVALAIEWHGSATFGRLDAISRGIVAAQEAQMAAGQPLVLICDSDVGGLLGLHLREELGHTGGLVSIDGVELSEFDYIDIGNLIPASGATPVVIKSLVFPHHGEKS